MFSSSFTWTCMFIGSLMWENSMITSSKLDYHKRRNIWFHHWRVEYRLLPSQSLQRWPAENQVSRRSPNNACTVHCEEYKHPLRSHSSPPTWWKQSLVNAHGNLVSRKQKVNGGKSNCSFRTNFTALSSSYTVGTGMIFKHGQREIFVYFTDIFSSSTFKMICKMFLHLLCCGIYTLCLFSVSSFL